MDAQQVAGTNAVARKRGANPETALMKATLEALRVVGVFAWRQNPIAPPLRVDGRMFYRSNASGMTGLSDIGGVCPGGRFIAVEVKGQTTPLTHKQALYLDSVTRIGGIAMVVRDVDTLRRFLDSVRGPTWYGVVSPYTLTATQREKHTQAAFREDQKRAQRRRR